MRPRQPGARSSANAARVRVLISLARFAAGVGAGTALVTALWVSYVESSLDMGDLATIAWQGAPFAVASVALMWRATLGGGLVSLAGAAAVALVASAAAEASADPFSFVFIFLAPPLSLILVAAVIGL